MQIYGLLLGPQGGLRSDITHEVAPLVLKHEVKVEQTIARLRFLTCDADEERRRTGSPVALPRRKGPFIISAMALSNDYPTLIP